MKAVKGKLLKKLKTIKSIGYLKPERILKVNALDGFQSNSLSRSPFVEIEVEPMKPPTEENTFPVQEPEVIDVTELMKDLEDQETESDGDINDKENITPETNTNDESEGKSERMGSLKSRNETCESKEFGATEEKIQPLSEIPISCFRPPHSDSNTLFDPNLLAAFEQAVMEVKAREAKLGEEEIDQPTLKSREIEEFNDPLLEFQEKCPPGGNDSVVLYVTGLRGIRKTFEDCHKLRSLLENLRILFFERDMSMHSGYKEELFEILEGKVAPPRMFIKGRYIGGADEVLGLHEQGKLKSLIEGIPIDRNEGPCEGCCGVRFIVCFNCNGSRRIVPEGSAQAVVLDCKECNENGVIICPFCC